MTLLPFFGLRSYALLPKLSSLTSITFCCVFSPLMRKTPYVVSLPILAAIIALSLTSLIRPAWIITRSPRVDPLDTHINYGLWRKCTRIYGYKDEHPPSLFKNPTNPRLAWEETPSVPANQTQPPGISGWACEPFPTRSECEAAGTEGFCVIWATAGYLGLLSLGPLLVSVVALLIIALGCGERQVRKDRRKIGWKAVGICLIVTAVLQIATFSLIVHVQRTDPARFALQSRLGASFYLSLVAIVLSLALFAGLIYTGLAARAGKTWAGGKSARHRHTRQRSRSSRHQRQTSLGSAAGDAPEVDENAPLLGGGRD